MTTSVDINRDPAEVIARLRQGTTLAAEHTDRAEVNKRELTERLIVDRGCLGDDKYSAPMKKNMKPEEAIEGLCGTKKMSADSLTSIVDVAVSALATLGQTDLDGGKAAANVQRPSA